MASQPNRDFVSFYARRQPNHLAAEDLASGATWTYAELDRSIACCATALRDQGIQRGDRVAALSRNSVHVIILHLACSRWGAIFIPLNWRLAPAELREIVVDASPSLLIFDDRSAELVVASGDGIKTLRLTELVDAIAAACPSNFELVDEDAPAMLLYTSGTSGTPKGVVLSERNAFFTGVNFSISASITTESVLLCDAPMFHVMGLVIGLRGIIHQGATILVSDKFEPNVTNDRLCDPSLQVTHYICVPQMAAALRAAHDFEPARLSRLTALIVGGAPSNAASVTAWLDDGIVIANGFGMTEIGAGAGMPLDRELIRARPLSAGLFPPTQWARITREGRDVPFGAAGELWVKGPNVSRGYWRKPEETAKAFTADGWFKTGDIGIIDADGFLTLVDRKKDMYISGGENVYPAEVEKVLLSFPGVAEAAVVGVNDTRWGEVGCACLVVSPGVELDLHHLRNHCHHQLAGYKVPKQFVIAQHLPRTGSGKTLKHVLKHEIENGRLLTLR
jgi:fatty-acyl-CoA synthase